MSLVMLKCMPAALKRRRIFKREKDGKCYFIFAIPPDQKKLKHIDQLTMTGRGVDNKGRKMKMAKETEEPTMFGKSPPMKKKHSMSDKSPALNSFDVFQAFVADANREVDALFSKFAEVMSERAAVDCSQIRELEDMVKEVKALESHLMERKERLRRSLAAISDKLQE